jgi:hypothetical protein
MGVLLGGAASPVGWWVSFLETGSERLTEALMRWREELGQTVTPSGAEAFPGCLGLLEPLETPWTAELLIDCGHWTAYLNNAIDGGDPTSAAPHLATMLGVRCVVAGHSPLYGPGHGGTQLWVLGPDGEPPLMYRRTIAAVSTDGSWEWHEGGEPYEWERQEQYGTRSIRDRFDRPLLLEYLATFGIAADDDGFYGSGRAVRQEV